MEFFIRKGATDPMLKMRLVDDGRNDKSSLNDLLENADITFDMFEVETEIPHILGGQCYLTTREKKYDQTTDEYYITFRFNEEHTKESGKFEGIINIQFRDTNLQPTNKLIVPIREKLFINII